MGSVLPNTKETIEILQKKLSKKIQRVSQKQKSLGRLIRLLTLKRDYLGERRTTEMIEPSELKVQAGRDN